MYFCINLNKVTMGLLDFMLKGQTKKSGLRLWQGKSGDYWKSSGSGRKGLTEFFFPKKKN